MDAFLGLALLPRPACAFDALLAFSTLALLLATVPFFFGLGLRPFRAGVGAAAVAVAEALAAGPVFLGLALRPRLACAFCALVAISTLTLLLDTVAFFFGLVLLPFRAGVGAVAVAVVEALAAAGALLGLALRPRLAGAFGALIAFSTLALLVATVPFFFALGLLLFRAGAGAGEAALATVAAFLGLALRPLLLCRTSVPRAVDFFGLTLLPRRAWSSAGTGAFFELALLAIATLSFGLILRMRLVCPRDALV